MRHVSPIEWPFFDAEHRQFATEFQAWVSACLSDFEMNEGGDGLAAREIFRLLGTSKWLQDTIALHSELPDPQMDLRRICLMREALGYSSAIADVVLSEPWLAALPVVLYDSPEQQRKYLPLYSTGECLPAFALSEPEAGSDVASIRTSATSSRNGYLLNGRKTWISNSGLADVYVVFARTEGESGTHGITAFLVEGSNPGVTLEERLRVMPPHTVGTRRFKNCYVESSS